MVMRIAFILLFVFNAACTTPAQRYAQKAAALGYSETTLETQNFVHRIYSNSQFSAGAPSDRVHVYLDGDGTPWLQKRWKTADPTPRNTLMLELMAQDTLPAILLGRPCYHGLNQSANCPDDLWTAQRYSPQVVQSMVEALTEWLRLKPFPEVTLIGFSGGGTLAVLMAHYLKNVDMLVTVAGNLDTTAWVAYHGYEPLTGSLNPAELAPLPLQVRQIHMSGNVDASVPSTLRVAYIKRNPDAIYLIYQGYGHHCCWQEEWPQILDYVENPRLN